MQYRLQIYTMSEKDLLLTIAKMNVFKKNSVLIKTDYTVLEMKFTTI